MRWRAASIGFLRGCSGATAVEFGLVATPFFALLGAIMQTAFMMWAQQNLDFALQGAARSLLTGQFQTAHSGSTDQASMLTALKATMCGSGKSAAFSCADLKLDVTVESSFAGTAPPQAVDPSTKGWSTVFGTHYSCAPPGAIVIATAATKFPLYFGLLNAGLSRFSDGSALLEATTVFRTEPYGTSAC